MPILKALRAECAGMDAFELALGTVSTMLTNVLEHPEETKYRTVRLANKTFHERVGKHPSGLALLRAFGFEDATQDVSHTEGHTHLALPEADAAQLAQGLVVVEAAREASRQVHAEQMPQTQQAAVPSASSSANASAGSSTASRAEGKRPMPAPGSAAPDAKRAASTSTCAAGGMAASTAAEAADAAEGEVQAYELESYNAASIDAFFVLQVS